MKEERELLKGRKMNVHTFTYKCICVGTMSGGATGQGREGGGEKGGKGEER